MRNILAMVGLASIFALGTLQGCGDDDDDNGGAGTAGTAGTSAGTAGTGAGTAGTDAGGAGQGGAGAGGAGAGGTAGTAGTGGTAGTAGTGGTANACVYDAATAEPMDKCSDPDASACVKAICADPECAPKWTECEADAMCNAAVGCFAQCTVQGADSDNSFKTCLPVAGTSLGKAAPLTDCRAKQAACTATGTAGTGRHGRHGWRGRRGGRRGRRGGWRGRRGGWRGRLDVR